MRCPLSLSEIPRFAETEAVIILTTMLQRYRVEVKKDPRYANETFEERKTRLLYGQKTAVTTGTFINETPISMGVSFLLINDFLSLNLPY